MLDRVEPNLSAAVECPPRVGGTMTYVFYLLLVPVVLAVLNVALSGADSGQSDDNWYGSPEKARAGSGKSRERVSV